MTINKAFYPGLNRVLVKELDMPLNARNILAIPDSRFKYGIIEAVGSIKERNEIDETTYKVGDHVYFLAQSGIAMDLDDATFKLLNVQEILVGKRAD